MKHSGGLAALRSLCQAALPAEAFVPAALETLHRVVPSYRNLFDWTGDDGEIARYWFEGPIDHEVASHYFAHFYNRRETEVMPAFRHAIRARSPVRGAQELDTPSFFRSALYNEVWRPQGLHTRIEALVRDARGRTLGSLVLYRAPGDPKFTAQDERMLQPVAAYLARGLEGASASPPADGFGATPACKALVTLDPRGQLQHVSSEALKLLMLAHGGVTPNAVTCPPSREMFPALDELWQRREAASGRCELARDNAWGRFALRGEPMRPLAAGAAPLLQVAIEHYELRAVTLRRALEHLPLSPAQREVCALLHRGESQASIARALRVAPSTVADHVRKAYARLDVHSVAELNAHLGECTRG